MFGLSALAARARELKGGASSTVEKGKKRPLSSVPGATSAARPKRARERVGREGAVTDGARPLQSRQLPAQAAAPSVPSSACPAVVPTVSISSSPEGSPGASAGPDRVGRMEVGPDRGGNVRDVGQEVGRAEVGVIGEAGGGEVNFAEVGCAGVSREGEVEVIPSPGASLESSGFLATVGSAGPPLEHESSPVETRSVFTSHRLCFELLEELHHRFSQDAQRLGELKLNRLVDRSCSNAIQGALMTGQLHLALGEMQAERNALQVRVLELETRESENGGWERKVAEAREQAGIAEGKLKAASEQLRATEERRSVSEERAKEADKRAQQFEVRAKAADEKCQRAEEKGRDLVRQAKQVQNEAHEATSKLLSRELELKDAQAQVKGLTAELESVRGGLARVGELQAELESARAEARDLQQIIQEAERRAAHAEEAALTSLTDAYLHGFNNCRRQVETLLPGADLSGLDEGDDGCSGGLGAQSSDIAPERSSGPDLAQVSEIPSPDRDVAAISIVAPGDPGATE